MLSSLGQVRRGDAMTIETCAQILQILGIPLMRPRVRELASAMGDALRGATLAEIRFCSSFVLWLEVFPDEMHRAVAGLEPERLAKELSVALPRHWRRLFALLMFAQRAGTGFGMQLVDSLSDSFVDSVRQYGASHAYELRVLLWQLTYGRGEVRRVLGAHLYEVVRAACRGTKHESNALLKAYAAVDLEQAKRLGDELGRKVPETNELDMMNRPFLDGLPSGHEARRELTRLESLGEDYDVGLALHVPDKLFDER